MSILIVSLLLSEWNLPAHAKRGAAEFPNQLIEDCTPISLDTVVTGSISALGETDCFAFDGTIGDRVLIRILVTGGTAFVPYFNLVRPDITWVCSDYGGASLWQECFLDTIGTYFLLLNDSSGDQTGSYILKVQKTNDPTNATSIAFGQVVAGSISAVLEMNAYTFSATAGDHVLIRILDTGGTAYIPQFALYRPNGAWIDASQYDPLGEGVFLLDATGTYLILVGDYGGDQTGDYNLYIQKTNDPTNALPIAFDQVISGSISAVLDTNAYTFSATEGDRLLIRILDMDDTAHIPQFALYHPNGAWLCSSFGDHFAEGECALDTTGTYAILVSDYGGDQTGSYSLYIQKTNDPTNATPIAFGQVITGSISAVLDTNAYTFSATAGDQVLMRSLDTSGTAYIPQIAVYRPNGAWIDSIQYDPFGEAVIPLDTTGAHIILVGDYGGDQTGSYSFYIQRLNNPANQTPIAYGQTLSGEISIAPEMEVFAFTGNAGDYVIVRMQITSGSLDPNLRIYNLDGSLLCEEWTHLSLLETSCLLTTGGLHTIFAYGSGGQTGGYDIIIFRGHFMFIPYIVVGPSG